ncbi:MAG: isoprenylcysteine carboxylmethyltransferase family protein [Actinobacteria bacterium]|jgi:protein-S-isoprenylcysteine O-methyltransferase Ste14|nr:MAG: isoprenylcysteine carboxylmethyltransferase family protein [Actinomycetota bacterium]
MLEVLGDRLNARLESIPARKRTVFMYIFYAPIPLLITPWIMVRAGKSIDRAGRFKGLLPRPLNLFLAVPTAITGLFYVVWSWYYMVRLGKGHPFSQPDLNIQPSPSELVTSGPFAACRNPQSLGGLLVLISLALYVNSAGLLFFVLPTAGGLWNLLVVRSEEPGLERKFGEEYIAYKQAVPRYIPALKRRRP